MQAPGQQEAGQALHQQPQPGRQRPVVVDPADPGNQDQAQREAPDHHARQRTGATQHQAAGQQRHRDPDAAPTRGGHGMAAAFPGRVEQLAPA